MTNLNLLGRTIGRFEILSELGRGGMAVVYKARQSAPNRLVALKVLPPELTYDKSYVARFHQEADSAAALEHPHIVPIYDVNEAEGYHYIAMKYINGQTLKDIVQSHGRLEIEHAITLLDQVAGALDYAHSRGVIHRDIKPSNMMTEQNGWVYLTDFGLARGSANSGLTQTGTVMGTPEYMSPEQAQGLPTIGTPTDIYALGVVLYELLTGNMPFSADTPMGMLVARLQQAPRPPTAYRGDLPLPVEDVIMRALARKPEARYASAKELIGALRNAAGLGGVPLSSPQRPVSPPLGTPISPPGGAQAASPPQGVQRPISAPPMPPTAPAGTPPYVIPASAGAAPASAPRPATPAAATVMSGLPAAGESHPPAAAPPASPARSSRGLWIGIGAVVLLLALVGGGFAASRAMGDSARNEQIAQALQSGEAALAEKGGFDQAIAAYQNVLTIDPNNVEAHSRLALMYNLRGRYEDGEAAARAAIGADDDAAFAYAMLADSLNNLGDREAALEAADKAVDIDDELSVGYGSRASIRADKALDESDTALLEDAAADADTAIAAAGDEDNLAKALAHSARGYVYWQEYSASNDSSKVSRGVQEFNQAIGLQPQIALFHSNLGYFYDAQGDHRLAQEKFETALEADPEYGHAHAGLGWNLYYEQDYRGAIQEFDKAIELDEKDADAYIGKSYVYQAQDPIDYDQSIATLQTAAELVPTRPSIFSELGWAHRNRASGYAYGSDEQKQGYDEAEAQFRKALELNDRYAQALTGLGWVLQDKGSVLGNNELYFESVNELEKSLEVKEDQPYAYNALGWSYYYLGEHTKAVEAFTRAFELQPDYANAYYGLGITLEGQGDPDGAREAYQNAVDLGSIEAQDALNAMQ